MYAYQLFEKIKNQALAAYRESNNKIMYFAGCNLFSQMREEGFSKEESCQAVIGGFACVACNDGKVSRDEFNAYVTMTGDNSLDYDTFFNIMSKYNKQQYRDNTVRLFNRIRNAETAHSFLSLCIGASIVDGRIAEAEETFCTSLCEVFLNRFDY